MRDWMRDIERRIQRVEAGGSSTLGVPSFGAVIELGGSISGGGVTITVTDTGGGARRVTFENEYSGSTYVINLP